MFKKNEHTPFTKDELAQWDADNIDISAEEGRDARGDVKRAFLAELVGARFKLQKAKEKYDLYKAAAKRSLR